MDYDQTSNITMTIAANTKVRAASTSLLVGLGLPMFRFSSCR
jgi:hypothetical protein